MLGAVLLSFAAAFAWYRFHTPEAYLERGYALQSRFRYSEAI